MSGSANSIGRKVASKDPPDDDTHEQRARRTLTLKRPFVHGGFGIEALPAGT